MAGSVLAGIIGAAACGADWPQFHGPTRDAVSAETGLARMWPVGGPDAGPPVVWTQTLGPGFGGAAVRDGEVFVLDRVAEREDVLRCLDFATGEEKWKFAYAAAGRLGYGGSRTVPTVTEDRVYTIGPFGHVGCFDRTTHQPVWSFDMRVRFDGEMPMFGWAQSPLLVDSMVIIAPFGDAGIVAIDARTGAEVWRTGHFGTSHSNPVLLDLAGRRQLVLLGRDGESGVLAGFDPATGARLWQTDAFWAKRSIPSPIRIDDNRLFITGGYRAGSLMLEITSAEGEAGADGAFVVREIFRHGRGSQLHVPLLVDGHLYLSANENWNDRGRRKEGGFMCLDLEGNERWRTGDDPYLGRGGSLLAGRMLIVQDGYNGSLRLVEPRPDGFRVLAQCDLFGVTDEKDHRLWAPMALTDGRLLVRSQTELKCIDLRPAAGPGSPPAEAG